MFDRLESHIGTQRAVLNVRSHRQELLASNIANADTPHFKARDLDFQAALNGALAGRSGLDLARTSPRHLEGLNEGPFSAALRYRTEYQGAVDGNTVDMDIERSAFAENTAQISASLTFIKEKLKGMAAAVAP